ncbi:hypothetical protein J2S17_002661 [Cytobacillus purgationiresistens]|uniref:Uncharacterized protein n=1 Tax=Cytobacillus purgationiresistens TaxID=863449 RepID=A0ABU0AHN9_9BACI|nr:hypothetical protein [Cytobacillus purgationiresistens]
MFSNHFINEYAQTEENKTSFERKIERIKHDGVRNYDADTTESMSDLLPSIKAVRLG